MQHWHSYQIRQYRLQFIRAFSGFSVKNGAGTANEEIVRVPCRYGDQSRIAASIVKGNSENKIPTVPFIACSVRNISMAANRRQDPQFVRSIQVNERKYDQEQQKYLDQIGNRYTVDSYMPVPYELTMQVDIWTNNEDTKEQIMEQIFMLYNPTIDIQTSTNPLDWTVLSYIEMVDSITWSSRSIPIGTDNPIDVATIEFKMPIWINPPSKVKKQAIIQEIITNVVEGNIDPGAMEWNSYELLSRTITTPHDAHIEVESISGYDYRLKLCDPTGSTIDPKKLATITMSISSPNVTIGMSFIWNSITCNILHTDLPSIVDDIRASLVGTSLNCVLFNTDTIQFINNTGGDNIFSDNVVGTLAAFGLQEVTYPGGNLAWWRLISEYGDIKTYATYGSNASQIRLKTNDELDEINTDIVGWVDFDPIDQNQLIWHADRNSFPTITLPPISAIIDPSISGPGINLSSAAQGQRYLITSDMPTSSVAWGTVDSKENDIIEFNGTTWQSVWIAKDNIGVIFTVMNSRSNKPYVWNNTYWTAIIKKTYSQGFWRLTI